jgi:hypothetical protein
MPENKSSEKIEWCSLPSKLKQQWLCGNNMLQEERDLWQKHAPKVFEDVVCYSQALIDNNGFSDPIPVVTKLINTTSRKRQLAYAYQYKETLLSQAKEANLHPNEIEYEYACENIGYELGFLFGYTSAIKT